jgi:hypothetical protein
LTAAGRAWTNRLRRLRIPPSAREPPKNAATDVLHAHPRNLMPASIPGGRSRTIMRRSAFAGFAERASPRPGIEAITKSCSVLSRIRDFAIGHRASLGREARMLSSASSRFKARPSPPTARVSSRRRHLSARPREGRAHAGCFAARTPFACGRVCSAPAARRTDTRARSRPLP